MAIYHFTAKVISRSKGRSTVAAAAYRSASETRDYRRDLTFDYAAKPDVIHPEILAPEGAPQWVHDRELLWNAVEAGEKRRDAQVAREVEFALPEELNRAEAIALAREFVEREFVSRGMVADLNVHWDQGNPHAHVMLTMRELTPCVASIISFWSRQSFLSVVARLKGPLDPITLKGGRSDILI